MYRRGHTKGTFDDRLWCDSDDYRRAGEMSSRGRDRELEGRETSNYVRTGYETRADPQRSHSRAEPSLSTVEPYSRGDGLGRNVNAGATDQGYARNQSSIEGSYVSIREVYGLRGSSPDGSRRSPSRERYKKTDDPPSSYYNSIFERTYNVAPERRQLVRHQDHRDDIEFSQARRWEDRYRQDSTRQDLSGQGSSGLVLTRPESYRPNSRRSELHKPDIYKPDSYRPDSYRPESRRPDSQRPDSRRPDSHRFDSQRLDAHRPDLYRPDSHRRYSPDPYDQDSRSRMRLADERYNQSSYQEPRNEHPSGSARYKRDYNAREPHGQSQATYEVARPLFDAPARSRDSPARKRNRFENYSPPPFRPKDRVDGFNPHRGTFEKVDFDEKHAFDDRAPQKERQKRKLVRGVTAARLAYNFERGRVYGDGEDGGEGDGPTQEEVILGLDPSFGNRNTGTQKARERRKENARVRAGTDVKRQKRKHVRGVTAAKLAYNFERGRVYGGGEDGGEGDGPTQEEVILGLDPSFGNRNTGMQKANEAGEDNAYVRAVADVRRKVGKPLDTAKWRETAFSDVSVQAQLKRMTANLSTQIDEQKQANCNWLRTSWTRGQ